MNGVNNNGGNRDYNMILEQARGATDQVSSLAQEAHHQMEGIMATGMRFAGALAGLLGGVLGSCGGGCGGI
jgi:hypothetical protein